VCVCVYVFVCVCVCVCVCVLHMFAMVCLGIYILCCCVGYIRARYGTWKLVVYTRAYDPTSCSDCIKQVYLWLYLHGMVQNDRVHGMWLYVVCGMWYVVYVHGMWLYVVVCGCMWLWHVVVRGCMWLYVHGMVNTEWSCNQQIMLHQFDLFCRMGVFQCVFSVCSVCVQFVQCVFSVWASQVLTRG